MDGSIHCEPSKQSVSVSIAGPTERRRSPVVACFEGRNQTNTTFIGLYERRYFPFLIGPTVYSIIDMLPTKASGLFSPGAERSRSADASQIGVGVVGWDKQPRHSCVGCKACGTVSFYCHSV